MRHTKVKRFLSDEHFTVMPEACFQHNGTLVEAWASMKSFRAKDGSDEPPAPGRNGERDFKGEARANDTYASTTDPDMRPRPSKASNPIAALSEGELEALEAILAGVSVSPVDQPGHDGSTKSLILGTQSDCS